MVVEGSAAGVADGVYESAGVSDIDVMCGKGDGGGLVSERGSVIEVDIASGGVEGEGIGGVEVALQGDIASGGEVEGMEGGGGVEGNVIGFVEEEVAGGIECECGGIDIESVERGSESAV
ncbi:MAG: hypothetical protein IPK79_12045 [Vampirovibrionales bacterium]|nr:hypothetical protein [Vampirovibrionales bacterium]